MNEKVTWNRQHGFTKCKWCLTSLVAFYDKMSGVVEEERAQDVICLDFSRTKHTHYSPTVVFYPG